MVMPEESIRSSAIFLWFLLVSAPEPMEDAGLLFVSSLALLGLRKCKAMCNCLYSKNKLRFSSIQSPMILIFSGGKTDLLAKLSTKLLPSHPHIWYLRQPWRCTSFEQWTEGNNENSSIWWARRKTDDNGRTQSMSMGIAG